MSPIETDLLDGSEIAVFIGIQSGGGYVPDFPLFNLTKQVGEHAVGATVTVQTLERLGYYAPAIPAGARAA